MSNQRRSISDYPEHLNPFYEGNEKLRFWKFGKVKRSGSFGATLRNTLTFKSFRGKKKDEQETPSSPPELRKQAPTIAPRQRQTLPTTLSPIYSPRNSPGLPLPRSRFSERVGKFNVNSEYEVPNGRVTKTASENSSLHNPFEEDEKVAELKPKRIRRRKRRAPLPPNMAREEGDDTYLGVSSRHSFSKWSLTSVETDVSTYSENEQLNLNTANEEMSEMMNNITKEMEKLTDDTNVRQTKETFDETFHSDIPDLIASSTEGIKKDEINKSTENASINVEHENKEQPTDENRNVVPQIICNNEERKTNDNNCIENETTLSSDEVRNKNCYVSEESPSAGEELKAAEKCGTQENAVVAESALENENGTSTASTDADEELKNVNNCDQNESTASRSECGTNRDSVSEKSLPGILYNATYNHASSVQDLNFNERKSIYITASNDHLEKSDSITNMENTIEARQTVDINQNRNPSPPTSPRCKTQVNVILNSHVQENINEEVMENSEDKEAVHRPIPKTRTSKPSKSDLLGNEIPDTD